jgi:hypothetical protein
MYAGNQGLGMNFVMSLQRGGYLDPVRGLLDKGFGRGSVMRSELTVSCSILVLTATNTDTCFIIPVAED